MTRVRILQVVDKMDRGGAETWLMHVMRHIDRERFRMDFLVHRAEPGAYDDEIRALGGKIIVSEGAGNPLRYALGFGRILKTHGPYDIVHSHLQYFNGVVLSLARMGGIPVRIAHSHLDTDLEDRSAHRMRRAYIATMRSCIRAHRTRGLAASQLAAAALFGPDWNRSPTTEVLYCGIDLASFAPSPESAITKQELGLPHDAFVVGHVGRFVPQKNQQFVVSIAQALAGKEADIHLLLVGDGPLRPHIEARIVALGLQDRVHTVGARPDVVALMKDAMDIAILPSTHEGLPLVAMEAQAAGLPIILSDRVSHEAVVVPELMSFLPIDDPDCWVKAILQVRESYSIPRSHEAYLRVQASPFNILHSVQHLQLVYDSP